MEVRLLCLAFFPRAFAFSILVGAMLNCKSDKQVAAKVGKEEIYLTEVDHLVRNSLHEYLSAIYDARMVAIEEIANSRILEMEAEFRGISPDSLIRAETARISKTRTLSRYITDNGLVSGVVDEVNPFKLHPTESPEGQRILKASYAKFLRLELIKDLKEKYPVQVLLSRPTAPKLDLSQTLMHSRGNLQSQHSITIISDFECPHCQRKAGEFEALYDRFKDSFRFNAILLAPVVNKRILLAECAARQGRFWEFYDAFYEITSGRRVDSSGLITTLDVGSKQVSCTDSSALAEKLKASMKCLQDLGINVTPTVLINNRIYYGPLNREAIGRFMEEILHKAPEVSMTTNSVPTPSRLRASGTR